VRGGKRSRVFRCMWSTCGAYISPTFKTLSPKNSSGWACSGDSSRVFYKKKGTHFKLFGQGNTTHPITGSQGHPSPLIFISGETEGLGGCPDIPYLKISNLSITNITQTTAEVLLSTNLASIAKVYYYRSKTTDPFDSVLSDVEKKDHVLYLSSLVPETEYRIQVVAETFNQIRMGPQNFFLKTLSGPLSRNKLDNNSKNQLRVFPNPFTQSIKISFTQPKVYNNRISIYSTNGRIVRSFGNVTTNSIVWDGRDNLGNKVSPGVYLIKAKAGDKVYSRKVVLER